MFLKALSLFRKGRFNRTLYLMLTFKCYFAHSRHKDDRACCRIIAGALDPDKKISPAQVSRKLKQLGLRSNVRKRKTTEKSDPQLSSTDDETLQTLANR